MTRTLLVLVLALLGIVLLGAMRRELQLSPIEVLRQHAVTEPSIRNGTGRYGGAP